MPVSMTALADDLAAESAVLRGLVADLDAAGWRRDTPAEGWTIADLGSTNGVKVNGRAIGAATPIRAGDDIVVGTVDVRFEVDR